MTGEIKTKGGATLKVSPAPFKDSIALKNAILNEVASGGVDLNADVESIADFIQIVAKVDASENVQKALFKCLERCSYNSQKITEVLFDDNIEARGDYYEIVIKCAEVNLSPFFKNLVSGFGDIMKRAKESLSQK